jgi:hypothetical protein
MLNFSCLLKAVKSKIPRCARADIAEILPLHFAQGQNDVWLASVYSRKNSR